MAEHYFSQCSTIVNGLRDSDVNFVALDFDLTLVNLHSYCDGAGWQGSSEELRTHLRPVFEAFIPLAIEKCKPYFITVQHFKFCSTKPFTLELSLSLLRRHLYEAYS